MTKGQQTKETILRETAQLFNRRGFFGAALSDVMAVTGLEKGGIYNHFKSKDDLAIQAFEYAVDLVRREITLAVKEKKHSVDRLKALITVFRREAEGFPLAGGCPVMNTAIEADDAHPILRARAQKAMDEWHHFVQRTVQRGKEKGEIKPGVNGEMLSFILISTMEGALMQSKLYGHLKPIDKAMSYLNEYLEREVKAAEV